MCPAVSSTVALRLYPVKTAHVAWVWTFICAHDFLCQIASEHRLHRLLQMRNIYSWTLLHFDVLSSAGRRQLFSYSCKKSPLYSRQSFHSCFWQEMILHSIHPRPLALPFHSWESLVFLSVYVCVFCNMTATKYPKDLLEGCCTYKKKVWNILKFFLYNGSSQIQRPALKVRFSSPNTKDGYLYVLNPPT